jgi:hypothetical protein
VPIYPGTAMFPSRYTFLGGWPLRDVSLECVLDGDRWSAALDESRWSVTLEVPVPRNIRTSLGDSAYATAVITELNGADLASATFEVALGTRAAPTTPWVTPDVIDVLTTSSRRVKVMVGAGATIDPQPGSGWLWVRIADSPETESIPALNDRLTIL